MDLTLSDVAELLNISESTLRRWIAEGKIPAYKIHGKYRFSRLEIESWVMNHRLGHVDGKSPFAAEDDENQNELVQDHQKFSLKEAPSLKKGGSQKFSLYRALHKGEVLKNIPGSSKEDVIRNGTRLLSKKLHFDHELLSELLLDREKLHPTALNNGIAVPHARDFLFSKTHDAIAILFPENPIPYGALDGHAVHTLIFLFACSDKRHLHLLAKIAHLASQGPTLNLFAAQPGKDKLLAYVQQWESNIAHPEE